MLQSVIRPRRKRPASSIGKATKAMERACKLAGLATFTHHCMRHYLVSNAIEAGVDFKTIAAWVGHKDGGLLVAKTYGQDIRGTSVHRGIRGRSFDVHRSRVSGEGNLGKRQGR